MTNEFRQTRQRTNILRDELIEDELRQVTKGWYIIAPIERYSSYVYFQQKKKVFHYHRCPDSVYFNMMLIIIYLSAIKILVCRRERRDCFLRFCIKYDT